eukprot:TRINITY_DN24038_c0_g1_i1.p1 TRINITY_DN24038_c0_g1~~TRINITY_DN24038_c0_g1_i1.p1  ORF type:complete len:586 (+),score=140.59 TRINITY_DN24038_c0_g1_i1:88-1758(+)
MDHAIRHRLMSRHPRVLAAPYHAGRFDSSLALVRGDVVEKYAALPVGMLRQRYHYVSADTTASLEEVTESLNRVTHLKRNLAPGNMPHPEFDTQPLPVTGLNRRKSVIFRFDAQKLGPAASRAALSISSDATPFRMLYGVDNLEKHGGWCSTLMRHQNIVTIVRPPLQPWKRFLRRRRRRHSGEKRKGSKAAKAVPVEESIKAGLARVRRHGFLNYYPVPHDRREIAPALLVGSALAGAYKVAVENYLLRTCTHGQVSKQAYLLYKHGSRDEADYSTVLERGNGIDFPRLRRLYSAILNKETSWRQVYHMVPNADKLQPMLSIREHIFNYMTSIRLAVYGLNVVEGDLVRDVGGAVRYVAAEDVSRFSIYDVVLPVVTLPYSHKVVMFPQHLVSEGLVEEVLSDFGVSLSEMNANQELYQDWCALFPDSMHLEQYRHIIVRPAKLHWKFIPTEDVPVRPGAEETHNFMATLGNLGDTPLQAPLTSPGNRVAVTADLPTTSNMASLMREVFMAPTLGGIPKTWQMATFRPGSMIHPDESDDLSPEEMQRIAVSASGL